MTMPQDLDRSSGAAGRVIERLTSALPSLAEYAELARHARLAVDASAVERDARAVCATYGALRKTIGVGLDVLA